MIDACHWNCESCVELQLLFNNNWTEVEEVVEVDVVVPLGGLSASCFQSVKKLKLHFPTRPPPFGNWKPPAPPLLLLLLLLLHLEILPRCSSDSLPATAWQVWMRLISAPAVAMVKEVKALGYQESNWPAELKHVSSWQRVDIQNPRPFIQSILFPPTSPFHFPLFKDEIHRQILNWLQTPLEIRYQFQSDQQQLWCCR